MNLLHLIMCTQNPNLNVLFEKFKDPEILSFNDDLTCITFSPNSHHRTTIVATDTGLGYMISYEHGAQSFIPY